MGPLQQPTFFIVGCGRLAHADPNAGRNLASLACLFRQATGAVNRPNVAKGSAL